MADKNPIASWLFSKRSFFNPNFTEFDWPARYFPGLSDFSTRLQIIGIPYEGRGVDESPLIALEKSVAEAVERFIWKRLGLSFHGFAVSGSENSRSHAMCEALERYFLYMHLTEKIPFLKIAVSATSQKIVTQFQKFNSESGVSFYHMASPSPFSGVVCRIQAPDQSIFLGFALSYNENRSISKAFCEAVANFAWGRENKAQVDAKEIPWHLSANFVSKIQPLFSGDLSSFRTIETPKLELTAVAVENIGELEGCPLSPIGCTVVGQEPFVW